MKYRVLLPVGFTQDGKGVSAWPPSIVEVDDDQAAPLVERGLLEPVEGVEGSTGQVVDVPVEPGGLSVTEVETDKQAAKSRRSPKQVEES